MDGLKRCGCESSLCDHEDRCEREVDPRLQMAYVVDTCTQCAANMAATGGGEYLSLAPDSPDTVRAYAPDATRRAAFAFGREHGTCSVRWLVRDDGAFDVTATKRGGAKVSTVISRDGSRR